VVSEEHVNLPGKLALKSRQEINQLMRFIAAQGIKKRPVHQFLKNQVSIRMRAQIGSFQETAKVFQIAMQIACHQDILGPG
jgi:hypothetical protein